MRLLFHCPWAVMFLFAWLPAASAQQPGAAEVLKQGKAATALVEVKVRNAHATAFCVHPSGLFVTNEHVIRFAGDGGVVNLILDPSLKTQKIRSARVIRTDKELDLALLRVEGEGTFPALALGSSDGLVELTEVMALGFPFGKRLALEKEAYPAVSVNKGQVTSLRQKDGELWRVQVDAVLNPGNSGGPVLDSKGKVVGVVVSGVLGAQVNFVIPVSHVQRFVARPDLQLIPPAIKLATMHSPALFQAKAMAVLPSADPIGLDLILDDGDGKERRQKMEPAAGVYRVTAIPVPPPDGPPVLRLTLSYDNGLVQGTLLDRKIKVGNKDLKLADVRTLQLRPRPQAVLNTGEIVEGALGGVDPLPLRLGNEEFRYSLTRAVKVNIEPLRAITAVSCTLVATQGAKEVGRLTRTIALQGLPTEVAGGPGLVSIEPVFLDRPKVEKPLPAPVSDLVVGGGGRYLILHMPTARSLAIFDVSQARVVHTIPLTEEAIRFAAGAEKLIIIHAATNILQRWNLKTLQRELIAPLPFKDKVHVAAMGSASAGPLFLGGPDTPGLGRTTIALMDIQTLKLLPLKPMDKRKTMIGFGDPGPVRASANGRVFTSWMGGSPSGVQTWTLEGDELRANYVGDSAGHVVPGQNGKVLFTSRRGLFTNEAKHIEGTDKDGRSGTVPAHNAPFFLGLRALAGGRSPKDSDKGLTVYLLGDPRPLAQLPEIDELREGLDHWGRSTLTIDKRLHFVPDAKLILTLPYSNDKLVLHRFDVDEALAKSGIDYLLLTSEPPAAVKKGETYSYQIGVKSRKGGVCYQLSSGPDGLTVSPSGRVSWTAPTNFPGTEAGVLVLVSDDSRQELFHSFKIRVSE